ncbi:hypothetical protein CRUP_021332, partial [Coryphaenoides rupestris]
DGGVTAALEPSDLRLNASELAAQLSGGPRPRLLPFQNRSAAAGGLPPPLVFGVPHPGRAYTVGLLAWAGAGWSRPLHSVTLLTRPLPVDSASVSDYREAPETGVVFEIHSPPNNVFNFSRGRTVFRHWLPGVCYRNITFQLVSEATVNRSAVVRRSRVSQRPLQHRTVPNPPRNVTWRLVPLGRQRLDGAPRGAAPDPARPGDTPGGTAPPRRASRDLPLTEERDQGELLQTHRDQNLFEDDLAATDAPAQNATAADYATDATDYSANVNSANGSEASEVGEDSALRAHGYDWLDPTGGPSATGDRRDPREDFVNGATPDYEDSNEPGSALGPPGPGAAPPPAGLPPLLLELHWLPPAPPANHDGFTVYISRDGNVTETATVDENTHEFFTEPTEPGTYRVLVTALSVAGDCEARESGPSTAFTFYLSPDGQCMQEPKERPHSVSVRLLGPSTAAVSWGPTSEEHNGSLVSVLSITCLRPSLNQRMESTYCTEENSTSDIIGSLTPGAQYRVVVYHTNGPLISPPSEAVIIDIEPTGVRDLAVYPMSPTAVILTWQRPYHVAFRKYVLQTFFFNPVTLASEWTTYYEIAATASVVASVRVTDMLPAWYYNFRVSMVTWGDPPLSCCDSSTVSYITAPEAPHISSVDYSHGVLYVRWSYGELFVDLSHSRMLHWQVVAVTRNSMRASLPLPPGDIYNLTVTACTERSRNTSMPNIIKLEPAPPRALYAVNATHSSVTLLWSVEGVVDYYQVLCRPARTSAEDKPSSAYNCSVTTYSYSTASRPAYISVSTVAKEMNPGMAAISALAVLSVLLLSLLLLFLLLLRKKHLQMTRAGGAETFVNFASFERDGKLPYNWRRSLFAFLTLLPSCLWTDYLLAFYINPWSKTALKKRKLTSPVQLDDFEAYLKDMSKDSAYKFSLQFEELKTVGLDLSHDAADLPINRPKNRYTNILPYDFSRVKLISVHNDEGVDYINANYIPGYKSPREYIATQGPLPETRNEFWKMVLQQKSPIIVMLTQCNERRRVKCDHYWPFTDEPVMYGEVSVEMLAEVESPEWTIRNFRLGYADESQDVLHLNYTSWPDHGVPTVNAIESILQFVHIVRHQANKSRDPVVVHCSAGVGRTGTFMALDRLMQHIREHDYADILGMVSEMRSHRLSMVQTEEQYVFIHQCVLLMWKKRKMHSVTGDVIYENDTSPPVLQASILCYEFIVKPTN